MFGIYVYENKTNLFKEQHKINVINYITFARKLVNSFHTLIKKTFLSGERIEGEWCLKQSSRAASRVGPLPLRLKGGANLKHYKWAGAKLKWGGGSVNDATPAI